MYRCSVFFTWGKFEQKQIEIENHFFDGSLSVLSVLFTFNYTILLFLKGLAKDKKIWTENKANYSYISTVLYH